MSRRRTQNYLSSSERHWEHLQGHLHGSVSCLLLVNAGCAELIAPAICSERGIEKQVSLDGANDAAEVEKRIAGMLN